MLATSERWTFFHDKDSSIINDPDACAELVRQIRGSTHLVPESPELVFPDAFNRSAEADMEVSLQLICVFLSFRM